MTTATASEARSDGPTPGLVSRLRSVGIVAGWIAIVAPFVLDGVAILRANQVWLVHRLPDDAFYYLEIARRMANGQGSTFDGIHTTNGYHPLWQLLLVPLAAIFGSDAGFVRAALLLALAMSLGAVVLAVRLVRRVAGVGPALFGAIVVVHGTTVTRWANGMEGAAVVLALMVVVTAFVWWADQPEPWRAAACGLACAVAVLARLDLLVVIWMVPAAMAWRARSARAVLGWLYGMVALGLPALALWWWRFGHLASVSSTVKGFETTRAVDQQYGGYFTTGYLGVIRDTGRDYVREMLAIAGGSLWTRQKRASDLLSLGLVGLAMVGGYAGLSSRRREAEDRPPWSPAAWGVGLGVVMVAVKAAFDIVVAPAWAEAWYSAPERLVFPMALGLLAWRGGAWLAHRSEPLGVALVVGAVIVSLPQLSSSFLDSTDTPPVDSFWQDQIYLASNWVLDQGPSGVYGARDAGLLGYRLDGTASVVNLDGLVNDFDFADYLRGDPSLRERAAHEQVDYLVGRMTEPVLAEFSCGQVLWESPGKIPYADVLNPEVTEAPVYVVDVRDCR